MIAGLKMYFLGSLQKNKGMADILLYLSNMDVIILFLLVQGNVCNCKKLQL